MNELNRKYGNGGKWYLNPENYAEAYLDDPQRREYIEAFYRDMWRHDSRGSGKKMEEDDRELQPTELEAKIRERMNRQKTIHYGQVVPIEEIEQILSMSGCIQRFACLCRYMYENKTEFRSCYLVAQQPYSRLMELMKSIHSDYLDGEGVHGIEIVEPEEAIRHFREMDRAGLVHTVWTLHTPFTASICNCDPVHCSAMYVSTKNRHSSTLLMADYVAQIEEERCVGCRKCKMACQFAALEYSPALKKIRVNATRCIGCGVCRPQCPVSAIRLIDREENPNSAGHYEIRDVK